MWSSLQVNLSLYVCARVKTAISLRLQLNFTVILTINLRNELMLTIGF